MKIKTATGIQRFQDEKGYGKWFNMLFPLVKTRDSCQPNLAIEPSASHDLSEEEEVNRTFEDFVPVKKIKLTKKNNVAEAVELLKKVVEQDPAKELINYMREEAEKARKHELDLVELMLKHNNANQTNDSPPQHRPFTSSAAVQGNSTWNGPQYISFQNVDNPMYNMPAINQGQHFLNPPDTSAYGNCFIGQSNGTNFQK